VIVGIIRHYAYSYQHRLWRHAGVGEFGEKTLAGMHQDGLSKVGLGLGLALGLRLRLGLGLVSFVPIYNLYVAVAPPKLQSSQNLN